MDRFLTKDSCQGEGALVEPEFHWRAILRCRSEREESASTIFLKRYGSKRRFFRAGSQVSAPDQPARRTIVRDGNLSVECMDSAGPILPPMRRSVVDLALGEEFEGGMVRKASRIQVIRSGVGADQSRRRLRAFAQKNVSMAQPVCCHGHARLA